MKRVSGALALLLVAAGTAGCAAESPGVPDEYRTRLDAIARHDFPQSIVITDRNGALLATLAPEGYRTWIPLEEMPPSLRMAMIATEDETFYSNGGVDPGAVARAAFQNAQAGETVSGASTITMQLVRMVAFGHDERFEQSLERKIREAQLASEISAELTKDQILEAYLNIAYFGHRAYGVEAAANVYFGRLARNLTLSEATLLAGLPQSPANLDPFENLDGAVQRRRVVLDRMVAVEVLTKEQADAAAAEPVVLSTTEPAGRTARHFVDYVAKRLPEIVGADVAARGGFTVTTTLDLGLDDRLHQIAADHVATLREPHDVGDAAVVAMRPGTGEILAMVGGLDYDEPDTGQVNVATRPRQPGSAFKPIVYAAAMEAGWTPASLVWDIPYQFPGAVEGEAYVPKNYDGRYRGPVRVRQALANSLNAATIGLAADVGLPKIHETAASLGVDLGEDPYANGLSVALGAAEVPLLDLTGAYAALAAGGAYAPPTPILAVENFRGGGILATQVSTTVQVVTPESAWLVTNILRDREARRDAFGDGLPLVTTAQAAVKTGTSTDFRDNVTIGYTPYIAIGVWAGNKDGHPMRDVSGITGAAPIWHDAMEFVAGATELLVALGDGQPPNADFPRPEGVASAQVCDLGTLGLDGNCNAHEEFVSSAAVADERALAYGWFTVQGACSQSEAFQAPGGAMMLTAPRQPDIAAQVQGWARSRGIAVAPPACGDGAVTVAAVPDGLPRP